MMSGDILRGPIFVGIFRSTERVTRIPPRFTRASHQDLAWIFSRKRYRTVILPPDPVQWSER